MMFFRRYFSNFKRITTVKEALNCKIPETQREQTIIKGWVNSFRKQKKFTFIHLNDGSSPVDLQVVADTQLIETCNEILYGCAVEVGGALVKSTHPEQPVELQANVVELVGSCDTESYPFKVHTTHSPDYTRQYPHLRARSRQFSATLRVRNKAAMAVHQFFQDKGYINVHTPIITSGDCEGAGELFQVLPSKDATAAGSELDNKFFKTDAYLTVSGQLHAEAALCGMSRVYTFGPTFRAESSHTARHLAEFYMIEAETILKDSNNGLEELMELCEGLCKYVLSSLADNSSEDLSLFHSNEEETKKVFKQCLEKPYNRIAYSDAIELLQRSCEDNIPKFGDDLNNINERFLVEKLGGQPLFVTEYPASLKPFYAKACNNDSSKVQAIDLVMPGIGEVIGGSVREDDYAILDEKLNKFNNKANYQWYLDLRRYGSVPHGGFGLGFERLLQLALGIRNIRDVMLCPRYYGYCSM